MDAAHGSFGVRSIVMLERETERKNCTVELSIKRVVQCKGRSEKSGQKRIYGKRRGIRVLTEIVYKEFTEWCWGCS